MKQSNSIRFISKMPDLHYEAECFILNEAKPSSLNVRHVTYLLTSGYWRWCRAGWWRVWGRSRLGSCSCRPVWRWTSSSVGVGMSWWQQCCDHRIVIHIFDPLPKWEFVGKQNATKIASEIIQNSIHQSFWAPFMLLWPEQKSYNRLEVI